MITVLKLTFLIFFFYLFFSWKYWISYPLIRLILFLAPTSVCKCIQICINKLSVQIPVLLVFDRNDCSRSYKKRLVCDTGFTNICISFQENMLKLILNLYLCFIKFVYSSIVFIVCHIVETWNLEIKYLLIKLYIWWIL